MPIHKSPDRLGSDRPPVLRIVNTCQQIPNDSGRTQTEMLAIDKSLALKTLGDLSSRRWVVELTSKQMVQGLLELLWVNLHLMHCNSFQIVIASMLQLARA